MTLFLAYHGPLTTDLRLILFYRWRVSLVFFAVCPHMIDEFVRMGRIMYLINGRLIRRFRSLFLPRTV